MNRNFINRCRLGFSRVALLVYPPPGAFTRPLPDSWGLPDSYRPKNPLKITVNRLESPKKPEFLITMRAIKGFQHYLHTVFLSMKIHYKKYWPDRTLSTSELPITINTWIWRKRTLNALIRMILFLTWGVSCQILFSPMMYKWCFHQSLICLCHIMLNVKLNRYPNESISMYTLWYQIFHSPLCQAMLFHI